MCTVFHCWVNLHLIVNKIRKHIPNLEMDTEVILASVEAIVSDSTQAKQETAAEKIIIVTDDVQ